ncbi:hypothetical protein GCL60_06550 [Silvanigrella paludirubra]|uniref:Uncharacterized protein n=1 Tax=Silvanigrella paludirubra TaxID=2499159 RepID=A0A6N6VWW9_9BACT|nr:hypothetical protein [Silvanigrella paludirubra]KAB8039917.1 hypothetical protein GCL60_06550 [Silvanigrella paludirubra]
MNRNRFSSFLLSFILLSQFVISLNTFAESYFGSYLFCSSENGLRGNEYWKKKVNWNWSKGFTSNNQIDDKYKSFTFVNKSGTWINGFGDISAKTGQYYLLVRKTFENKQEAIRYCENLEKKCVNEFGPSYKYLGVSSWSIPQTAWGTIALRYKENLSIKWTTCSNWKYSDYKELNYYPVWKLVGSSIGYSYIAASGMLIYPIMWYIKGGFIGFTLSLAPGIIVAEEAVVVGTLAGVVAGTAYGVYIGLDEAYKIYKNIYNEVNNKED